MKRAYLLPVLLVVLSGPMAWSYFQKGEVGVDMTRAAEKYLASLNADQRAKSLMEYGTPQRVNWHFIPLDTRKGLQIKEMTPPQRVEALALVKAALSQVGYKKATEIMNLENLLKVLQDKAGKGGPLRDPERYYVTIFGQPSADGKWGLSFEGHHLSLNFVVEKGKVISSTPQFFATNPAEVKTDNDIVKKGTRILAQEELLAFKLIQSLTAEQASVAIIDKTALKEIISAGTPQPPTDKPAGLAAGKMTPTQQETLHQLIAEYIAAMPYDVAQQRTAAIEKAGFDNIHFAWAGATEPGIGHYYRIQGPTFYVELVNTQPDVAGNPANHVHCVWRNMAGDFALPIDQKIEKPAESK